ncbi:DeoR/GlpR family DNA-binding transcription regulator [Curtobacterium ammoniigenes]|uniref:DeoR/GlpR family DNA-binding transcription regulator n=1 Tax=Curtobacterium ammoniigenes TaxID=395387 RepID=UPI000834CC2E|nr:DeoR/GlpR family DNA-binding transcription regulator [Curtobacterium ammoniigenes]
MGRVEGLQSDAEGLPAPLRQDRIVALVHAAPGLVRTATLAAHLGTSEVTIRQDLAALDGAGRIRRVHGGALSATADGLANAERPYEETAVEHAAAKAAIGSAAAAMVESGMCVLLDVGTTTAAVAEALIARRDLADLTVVTNSLTNALALERAVPRFTVIVTGGTLRPLQHSLVAPFAGTILPMVHADLAIIGCTGVSARGGVTNVNLPETELKRQLVESARRTVVVADGHKIGRTDVGVICALDAVDRVITADVDQDSLEALRTAGVTVTVAQMAGRRGLDESSESTVFV